MHSTPRSRAQRKNAQRVRRRAALRDGAERCLPPDHPERREHAARVLQRAARFWSFAWHTCWMTPAKERFLDRVRRVDGVLDEWCRWGGRVRYSVAGELRGHGYVTTSLVDAELYDAASARHLIVTRSGSVYELAAHMSPGYSVASCKGQDRHVFAVVHPPVLRPHGTLTPRRSCTGTA